MSGFQAESECVSMLPSVRVILITLALISSSRFASQIVSRNSAIRDYGGRGGIRTHGGFPHARFRVECLKPDSATLPIARYCPRYFATRNRQTALSLQRQ